jgi:hypothetical protein
MSSKKYNDVHKNYSLLNYEKILYSDLSSSTINNYSIDYNINLINLSLSKSSNYQNGLKQLESYNNYLNEINNMILFSSNKLDTSEQNNISNSEFGIDKLKLIKIIKLNDLFNTHKINNLYNFIFNNSTDNDNELNINLKMNDILDHNIYIYHNLINKNLTNKNNLQNNLQNNLNIEAFTNEIILFINKLIKRKIVKTIRYYNYMQNKINIDNNN